MFRFLVSRGAGGLVLDGFWTSVLKIMSKMLKKTSVIVHIKASGLMYLKEVRVISKDASI